VAGITGRALDSKFLKVDDLSITPFFSTVRQWIPIDVGLEDAMTWANMQVTDRNPIYLREEGEPIGEHTASSWLKTIKYNVNNDLNEDSTNNSDELVFSNDEEDEVEFDGRNLLLFTATEVAQYVNTPTFLICPPFFARYLLMWTDIREVGMGIDFFYGNC
jgi:hypothetical protein